MRSPAPTERQRFGPELVPDWETAVGRQDRGLDFSFRFCFAVVGIIVLFFFVFSSVCVRVRRSQSGPCQTLVPFFPPEPNHHQRGSFALNSVASAWLGDNSGGPGVFAGPWVGGGGPPPPLWGSASHPHTAAIAVWGGWVVLCWGWGEEEGCPLISTSPGSQRSCRRPLGAHCAPHHCRRYVTFSAGGVAGWGERKRGQKEKKKRGNGGRREERERKNKWVNMSR